MQTAYSVHFQTRESNKKVAAQLRVIPFIYVKGNSRILAFLDLLNGFSCHVMQPHYLKIKTRASSEYTDILKCWIDI